ncbi:MAG: hypothetical protein ACK4IT_05755 [Thioalkalivibrionaceae bacterium]
MNKRAPLRSGLPRSVGVFQTLRRQVGIALVAVLGVMLAMALLTGAITRTVMIELRSTQAAEQRVRDDLLMESVARALAAEARVDGELLNRYRVQYWFLEGRDFEVQTVPTRGLISLGLAPDDLVAAAMVHRGGVAPDLADVLAPEFGARAREESLTQEDLMALLSDSPLTGEQVLQLAGVLSLWPGGAETVSLRAAPLEVLEILFAGNRAAAEALIEARDRGDDELDRSGIPEAWLAETSSSILLVMIRSKSDTWGVTAVSGWLSPAGLLPGGRDWVVSPLETLAPHPGADG